MRTDGTTSSSVVFWLGPTRYERLTGDLDRLRSYTWR